MMIMITNVRLKNFDIYLRGVRDILNIFNSIFQLFYVSLFKNMWETNNTGKDKIISQKWFGTWQGQFNEGKVLEER